MSDIINLFLKSIVEALTEFLANRRVFILVFKFFFKFLVFDDFLDELIVSNFRFKWCMLEGISESSFIVVDGIRKFNYATDSFVCDKFQVFISHPANAFGQLQ